MSDRLEVHERFLTDVMDAMRVDLLADDADDDDVFLTLARYNRLREQLIAALKALRVGLSAEAILADAGQDDTGTEATVLPFPRGGAHDHH